jgi:methylase of polypeptide subunit release factors
MVLDKIQQDQIKMQLKNHMHNDYKVYIILSESKILKDFEVHSKVLRPDKMTALFLARWLYYNNGYYNNKSILDMGSGTGIQGVVAGLSGALQTVFTDLSPAAVKIQKLM